MIALFVQKSLFKNDYLYFGRNCEVQKYNEI